jgi:hypothetical protein
VKPAVAVAALARKVRRRTGVDGFVSEGSGWLMGFS